ncbi:hypothetical protein J6590_038938 [Homalodisca vitripennis]|nr:hypothetical protein J6590_038938 [Homalodisca vitripennis]
MNHDTFSKWFRESLLPNLSAPSVIVMDNAPYHSKILDKAPTQEAWAQEGLIETAVEEMIIHVNADDSDSETSDLEDFAGEYRVQTDQGTQEIYVNRTYADEADDDDDDLDGITPLPATHGNVLEFSQY